jgi:uncharacterized membrane protein YraQ (UPF0718 family)
MATAVQDGEATGRPRNPLVALCAGTAALALALGTWGGRWLETPSLQTWSTMFVSVSFQALPFLVLGTLFAAVITALVPPGEISQMLPQNRALAVPAAGVVGIGLPGCECGSVPIAGRLIASGAPPAPALTFLLAAPAINPVVLVATAVAFPGQLEVVAARLVASLVTAVVVGWVWLRLGRDDLVDRARRRPRPAGTRLEVFRATAVHDLLHAGGYLVVGAMTAATLQVAVPTSILDALSGAGPLAVLALALLAVVLAVCSEADAFVAASLTQFSLTAKLAFLVVGPAVDVKLVALQAGTFGRGFAARFAPLTFAVAVTSAVAVGAVLL